MTIEQQVASLELSKRLKELGVKQESLWYHRSPVAHHGRPEWDIDTCMDSHADENYSAFTVAELGEVLPAINWQTYKDTDNKDCWVLTNHKNSMKAMEAETEADARAKMLIYILEQGLIKAEEA